MAWKFQAYRDLLRELGHGDGMAEVIEVATREFLAAAQRSGNPRDYLIVRSRAQGVVVDELDMDNLPVRAATLYIVGAFQQLEGFLTDLIDESDEVRGRQSRSRNKGESSLDWALDMLPGGRARNIRRIGSERYALLEYYRGIRNAFMHPNKKAASLEGPFKRADEYRELFFADFKLAAPNEPGKLKLDDFLLYTRVIKYLATDLCRIAEPTHDDIVSYALREFSGDLRMSRLTWDTIGRDKAEVRVIRYFKRHEYDMSLQNGLVKAIVDAQLAKYGR